MKRVRKVVVEREEFNGKRIANVIWKAVMPVAEETEAVSEDNVSQRRGDQGCGEERTT